MEKSGLLEEKPSMLEDGQRALAATVLGELGTELGDVVVDCIAPAELEPVITATHSEFNDFGVGQGYAIPVVGKAWSKLVILFNEEKHADKLGHLPKGIPLRFRKHPPFSDTNWTLAEERRVDDLEIESLRGLIKFIDEAVERLGQAQTIKRILGSSSSPKMLDLWREFCDWKLDEPDRTAEIQT